MYPKQKLLHHFLLISSKSEERMQMLNIHQGTHRGCFSSTPKWEKNTNVQHGMNNQINIHTGEASKCKRVIKYTINDRIDESENRHLLVCHSTESKSYFAVLNKKQAE